MTDHSPHVPRISVIVPARNEAGNIRDIIERIPQVMGDPSTSRLPGLAELLELFDDFEVALHVATTAISQPLPGMVTVDDDPELRQGPVGPGQQAGAGRANSSRRRGGAAR